MSSGNRYQRIIEHIFFNHYRDGVVEFVFDRPEIVAAAEELEIALPKNIGDIVYSFRYRAELPDSIRQCAPEGMHWIIRPAGSARYQFVATRLVTIIPNEMFSRIKVPDSTPGVIAKYALTDEQSLLARIRYNRLIDIFTGITCYSLQSHLRTQIPELGQVETDELYVGLDRSGAHYVVPVQAKGHADSLNVVQIEQDIALCRVRFPSLVSRPIGAQFMDNDLIALFEFEESDSEVTIGQERHYLLVPPDQVTDDDLRSYQQHIPN